MLVETNKMKNNLEASRVLDGPVKSKGAVFTNLYALSVNQR
jgi:hypothetical protein